MRFSVIEIKDTYTNTGVLVLNDYCITAVLYFWGGGGVCICLKFFDGIVVIIIMHVSFIYLIQVLLTQGVSA